MAVSVWVWLRGEFLLESFLPLNFSASSSSTSRNEESPCRSSAVDGAHALIDVCQARNWDRLSVLEWSNIVDEIGLDHALSEAVYRNASGEEITLISINLFKAHATLSCLALHILLAGLERFSYEADEIVEAFDCALALFVRTKEAVQDGTDSEGVKGSIGVDDFISVLCRCALGCSQAVLKKDRIRFNNQQLKELSTSMDLLFEGMTEDNEADKRHDHIVKVSEIMQDIWFEDNEISLRKLTANMRKCLVQDPFQIDDLSVDTAVYKDVHLRILSNKAESMFIAPWRSRSTIVDNIRSCSAMVLGPTNGTVVLREVHNTNVTVACKQLHLWKCSQVTVFLHSFRPPVVRGCVDVHFAAFNVSYEGLSEEMEAAKLRTVRYKSSKHIINDLLQKLPPFYRGQWENTMAEMQEPSDDRVSILPLKKSDLIYLRGKIASER
ncbi:unnamed protein product [Haemonchus placei]|uniref:C-CAP/cofactor C-like domain-containing protein n=1 Tax=Haemonchus placei TaxID=6290 RepID=A0A0N4WW07_HAEPC|nr:unnamed protein product [Haemonchus placei]